VTNLRLAAHDWVATYSGRTPTTESVEHVAKKFEVNPDDLKKEILQVGITDGWLIDEYFDPLSSALG